MNPVNPVVSRHCVNVMPMPNKKVNINSIGISTDAPTPGDFRVWVTDLRAGITLEQIGPPYGFPIDFFHPAEGEDPGTDGPMNRTVSLFFLGGRTARCGQVASASFYAYAVVMDRGRDPEWDFAPDAAWLKIR